MFFIPSTFIFPAPTTLTPEFNTRFRAPHFTALGIDLLLGITCLATGILATHYGFLPQAAQYVCIGAGGTYTGILLIVSGFAIKYRIILNLAAK